MREPSDRAEPRLADGAPPTTPETDRAGPAQRVFLATLCHDLRTPLNAIYGWAQLLKMGRYDAETLSEAIDAIHDNAQLLSRMIDKAARGEPRPSGRDATPARDE
jgi:signal transduction histidine kinase